MSHDPNIPEAMATAWRHCGIAVRGAWRFRRSRPWTSVHEGHWMLLMVNKGSVATEFSVGQFTMSQGDTLLAPPGLAARITPELGTIVVDIIFSAIPAPSMNVPWSMLELPLIVPDLNARSITTLPDRMQRHRWNNLEDALYARFQVDQFLWTMIKRAFELDLAKGKPRRPVWLRDAIKAVDSHLSDPAFQVAAFAQLAGCTPDHLNRVMKNSDGTSAGRFLRVTRLQRAAHMLEHDPEITTAFIVQQCGFGSARHFRDQWRMEMNTGLREFRKWLRCGNGPG